MDMNLPMPDVKASGGTSPEAVGSKTRRREAVMSTGRRILDLKVFSS